jgi:hypothetical protein
VLVDHRDADRGADHDGLVADRVGRAERGDQPVGDGLQRTVVAARVSDHRELVAADARHEIVAAQGAGEPLGHGPNQFVASRMAEGVVDVLEVIEVDVEHGSRRARALAHLVDRGLEPLAEEDPVGQAAQRVMQRKMPQARLAGGDGCGGAAHVAPDQEGEQRKARERDRDEREDAGDDFSARPLRHPGELRNCLTLPVGQIVDVFAVRRRMGLDQAQVAQLQARGDLSQDVLIDQLHAENDGRLGAHLGFGFALTGNRDRGDDRRPVEERLQARRAVLLPRDPQRLGAGK